jgi:hypothetical protein
MTGRPFTTLSVGRGKHSGEIIRVDHPVDGVPPGLPFFSPTIRVPPQLIRMFKRPSDGISTPPVSSAIETRRKEIIPPILSSFLDKITRVYYNFSVFA